MAKSVSLIKVLAAFPSDVADEARGLDGVANELNRMIGDVHSIRFEILNWLRDVHPGVGDDVQQVINKQVEDAYDVIVATFWSRAGTATPRAESGSIEEVRSAIRRARADGQLPHVLVYMKTMGVDLLQVDPEQVRLLRDFREWLSQEGVLYKPFADKSAFEALLRLDLSKIAATSAQKPTTLQVVVTSTNPPLVDDELGLLDYIDARDAGFARANELIDDQATLLDRLTRNQEEEIKQARALAQGKADRTAVRRLLKRSADTWNAFSYASEAKLAELQDATREAFDAMTRALSLTAPIDQAEKERAVTQLHSLINSARSSAEKTKDLRDSAAAFPRLTAEHNRARRKMTEIVDRWVIYFQDTAQLCEKMIDSITSA